MLSFPNATNVTVTVPFVDTNGAAVSAAGMTISYQVFDENETLVLDVTALPNPATTDTGVTIMVPASLNTLGGPQPNLNEGVPQGNPIIPITGVREVRLSMNVAVGSFTTSVRYLIKRQTQLVLMQDSFQAYNLALATADMIPNLGGWLTATDDQRIVALKEAYYRLTRLGYFVRWPRDPDAQNYIDWMNSRNEVIIPRLWQVMTNWRWYNYYPETFRQAMRMAQVVEADDVLTNDVYAMRRKAGVLEERVGESDTKFRNVKALDLGVGKRALAYIQGFVDIRMTIARGN